MAEKDDDLVESTPGYKAPAKVDLETLKNLDSNDESLVRWKQALLAGSSVVAGGDPRNVIVEKLMFVTEGREDIVLDLTGDLSTLKSKPVIIKEGCTYRLRIQFRVQRDVVSGLKYCQAVYRGPIRADKTNHMFGSYGPKADPQTAMTPLEEAPSGMLARGHYTVKSKFTDDDKTSHLEWEWSFDIKKSWGDKDE